jgi:hypothetical protein
MAYGAARCLTVRLCGAALVGGKRCPRRRPLTSSRGDAMPTLLLGVCWARFEVTGQPCGALIAMASHNNLALIVRVANPQPPLRDRPSLQHRGGRPRRARLARCRGSYLLWTGSAKDARLRRCRARQPAHGSVRHLDSAARKSDPAVGRSTHTRGTACLPRAALPNKAAPRP